LPSTIPEVYDGCCLPVRVHLGGSHLLQRTSIRVAILLVCVSAVPAFAGGSVAVIEADDPGTPSPTTGEPWCGLISANGYSCTLFPNSGPTGPLTGFDAVVDLSPVWADSGGQLPAFLSEGHTVVTHGGAPSALGINSTPSVRAWIGANSISGDGFDHLRTVATDPVLGSIPMGTDVEFCGDAGCPALHGEQTAFGAKSLARFGNGIGGSGILRNIWNGGVAVYLSQPVHPASGNPTHQAIILNAIRARSLTIPALNEWGLVCMALLLVVSATVLIRRRVRTQACALGTTSHPNRRAYPQIDAAGPQFATPAERGSNRT